jgi:hypothetical protein
MLLKHWEYSVGEEKIGAETEGWSAVQGRGLCVMRGGGRLREG